jgi:hypothetical protein
MIGGIDEIDSQFDSAMNHRNVALFVSLAELPLKRRTAVTDR